jgi:hypothetical protein
MPVKVVPVCEPESAMAKAAAVENMTAVKRCAAAVETTAVETAAMKAASTMTSTAMTSTAMTSATMAATAVAATAAGFGGQPVRDVFCDRYSTGIDQRKRLGALAGRGR